MIVYLKVLYLYVKYAIDIVFQQYPNPIFEKFDSYKDQSLRIFCTISDYHLPKIAPYKIDIF